MSDRTVTEVNGKQYQIGRLPALTQLHVARRLMPCLAGLTKAAPKVQEILPKDSTADEQTADLVLNEVIQPIAEALSTMKDEDVNYIVTTCLKCCYFKQDTGWAPMVNGAGQIMIADLQLPELLGVTLAVIKENLGGFFLGGPPS